MVFFGAAYVVTNRAPQLCASVSCMVRSTDESLWVRVTNACRLGRDGKAGPRGALRLVQHALIARGQSKAHDQQKIQRDIDAPQARHSRMATKNLKKINPFSRRANNSTTSTRCKRRKTNQCGYPRGRNRGGKTKGRCELLGNGAAA